TPTGPAVTPTRFVWSSTPSSGNLQGANTATITDTPSSNTTYTVTVTLPSGSTITPAPVTISVSAATLSVVGSNRPPAMANSTITLAVKVSDPNRSGNGIADIAVTWQLQNAQSGDALGASTTITGANGIATNTLKLG